MRRIFCLGLAIAMGTLAAPSQHARAAPFSSWNRSMDITIDNSAQTTDDLTDFPVLVLLNPTLTDNYTGFDPAGADLRFSLGNTVLDYEIATFDDSGQSQIWVRIPTIVAGSSGTTFRMHWDNSEVVDAQDAAGVWTPNYQTVLHLEDPALSTEADNSTGLGDAAEGPDGFTFGIAGMIGDAATSGINPGSGQLLQSPTIALGSDDYVFETWFDESLPGLGSTFSTLIRGTDDDHPVLVSSAGLLGMFDNNGGGFLSSGFDVDTLSSGLHHLVAVGDNTLGTTEYFIDGVSVGTSADVSSGNFGSIANIPVSNTQPWGLIDEFRFSQSLFTDDYVAANYLTQTNAFLTFGEIQVTPIPEPSSLLLLALGCCALVRRRWRLCSRVASLCDDSIGEANPVPKKSSPAGPTALNKRRSFALVAICAASALVLANALPALAVPVAPGVPLSGYLFDEGSGTTTADSFGSNDGTLVAMEPGDWVTTTPFTYVGNGSLNFDGTSEGSAGQRDRVSLGQPTNLNFVGGTDSFTISAWFQVDGTASNGNGTLVSKAQNTSTGRQWQAFITGDSAGANIGGASATGATNVALNNVWHHYAIVVTPGLASIYLNGNIVPETTFVPAAASNIMDVYIGARHGSNTANDTTTGFEMNGRIDEVGIWNTALATDNIEWLAANSLQDLIPQPLIPEPSSLLLLGLGLIGLKRRRRRL